MITLTFRTLPPHRVSPNYAGADRWKQQARRDWREELVRDGENQLRRMIGNPRARLPYPRARVSVVAFVRARAPRDGCYRPADPDNLVAACKALYDALTVPKGTPGLRGYRSGLGIVVDDRSPQMELGEARIEHVPDTSLEQLVVTIEEIEERDGGQE